MSNKLGLVTGSFDPITVGHLDIIERASKIFDRITVVVAHNEEKKYMFSPSQRLDIAKAAIKDLPNADAVLWDGYVADYAAEQGASAFVRGIRNEKDVSYEQNMADINYSKCGVDTVMLFANPKYNGVSSTQVRSAILKGEDINKFVPDNSAKLIYKYIFEKCQGAKS